ncbi:hypothetical protein CWE09_04520 [Aliidiomarina minuta]|uniref:Uncharacterized protein n=2 Tax=Aliidiomarina minuta TaxID=880057 RepID=A0A432W7G2_9GAMM|nr:hypothetical protein CWE09_04520 [Aliidiomarina minuta]
MKPPYRQYLIAIFSLVILLGCGNYESEETTIRFQEAEPRPDIDFQVIVDTYPSNMSRRVNINLPERISEDQLAKLAKYLSSTERQDQNHNRTYILYYVQGESRGTAWATTHFDPDLEVKILGATSQQFDDLTQDAPGVDIDGEVLGQWVANSGVSYRMLLHRAEDSTNYITSIFADGSSGTQEVETSQHARGTKLQSERGRSFDEYFILNSQGRLEFWDESENYYTAEAMD